MARNVHQNRRLKSRKPAAVSQPAAKSAEHNPQPVAAPAVPAKPVITKTAQQATAMRFAELPSELRRIALFTAFVVVLLIVLWFFIK